MKVAMLGWEFPPFVAGGLGVHCLELTRALAGRGAAVDFYMPAIGSGPPGRPAHLTLIEVPADARSAYGPGHYSREFNAAVATYNERLVEAFRSHDADVLHCHDWLTVPAGLALREQTGLPLVYTVHSTEHDRAAGPFAQAWIEGIEQRGVREADAVIAVSRYTKALVQRLYGGDPARVVAIHNGVDATAWHAPRDYGRDGAVLFLSRLARQKGPLHFLEAARRVLQRRPRTTFIIAGTGHMLDECIHYTIEHDLTDRVRFAGFVPGEELARTYQENQLYVLPSLSEPFGISALEAMAAGMPTIVTRNSGVAEATEHALKVAPGDVDELAEMILHVLESRELREELGTNGSKDIQRFTWDDCARQTMNTYTDVMTT